MVAEVGNRRVAARNPVLRANDFAGLDAPLKALFASIPHQWHTNNDIARCEGHYATVFYACFAGLGMDLTVEDSTSAGRVDLAVRFNANVYRFEFKVRERSPEGAAMAQLREKDYAEKYRCLGQPIHLFAVEFSEATRNLAGFEAASG